MSRPTKAKTGTNPASVRAFIRSIEDKRRREDFDALVSLMRDATGSRPKMWSDFVVGFGSYRARYKSGREQELPIVALSPRKQALTVNLGCDIPPNEPLLERLGKCKRGKSCLYIKRIADIDGDVLREIVRIQAQTAKEIRASR